jgi:phage anti-repressor protein
MNQIVKTEFVDFKTLVSKNNNISLNVQTKMIKELDKTFTEEESRWYIANFYIYMNYHPTNQYPINLENVLKMIGFAHKKNAKRTLENNFTKDEDYKITVLPSEHGQFATETIMLNIDTFKNLCMMIKTPQGKEIRKYYVKLENVYNKIIKEEIETQKLLLREQQNVIEEQKALVQEKDNQLENKESEYQQKSKDDKHKFLIDKFKSKKCIYLAEIDDDKIKIGSTNDISVRKNNLKDVFGKCIFTDFFECKYYREVEQNILVAVREHIYRKKIKDHLSKEVVQLSEQFNYNQLVGIVKKEIQSYDKYMFWNESTSTNYINKDNYSEIIDLLKENNVILKNIQNSLQNNSDEIIISQQFPSKQITSGQGTRGRKIQEIDPDNLSVIKNLYPSMIHVLRENTNYEKASIQRAIKNNLIYKGSRWLFVEHNQNQNIVNNIKETVSSNQPENNYILKVNLDQTEIVECFRGITEIRSKYKIGNQKIYSIIDNKTAFDNSYFMKITECPEDLLKNFELPTKWSKKAKSIKSTNINNNKTTIYKSITEVCVKTGIGYKKLENIINDKKIINECKWEYIN